MKKLILVLAGLLLSALTFAQNDSTQPAYKRFPTFPPIKLLLPDSSSIYTKNDLPKKTPVILMIFNPGCEHCRHETEEILKNMESFKDIHIVMATNMPFDTMMSFRRTFQLEKYKNIVVGQDTHYFLPGFYMMHNLPFLAFYNRKKELISVFEGSLPIPSILEIFKDKTD